MARYTNEDMISLCDRITAICNRLHKRCDAIEEQHPPTEAYGQPPYAGFDSSVQQPRQPDYMEWQQLPTQQSWELRPPDPGLPYGAPQYSSAVYSHLTPYHQQGDQNWQPSLHPITRPSNGRHLPPEYQPPPSPWMSSSCYLQESHLTQPPQPRSYSNSCWDPPGVYLTQPPYQPPCPPSCWNRPASVSEQLPFTNTDLYAPLQNSVPPNVTPWQTTAEPYFHNQSPPSQDYHQRPQLSSTTALPQQNYPKLQPPNAYQPPPICLDEKVTISEKESERFSSCGESTIVHEIVKHGHEDYSNSSLGERIIPVTGLSNVSSTGLGGTSEIMLHREIKEVSVVDVRVHNQVASVGAIEIVSHLSATLDADARLIPPRNAGGDFSGPIAAPILNPQDDDGLSSPTAHSVNSHSLSENNILNERKQRSVTDFRGENKYFSQESRKLEVLDKRGSVVEKSTTTGKEKQDNDGELKGVGSEQLSSTVEVEHNEELGRSDVNIDFHEMKEPLVMSSKELILKEVDSGMGRNEWNWGDSLDVFGSVDLVQHRPPLGNSKVSLGPSGLVPYDSSAPSQQPSTALSFELPPYAAPGPVRPLQPLPVTAPLLASNSLHQTNVPSSRKTEWEMNLHEGKEELCQSERHLNEREEKLIELNGTLKQRRENGNGDENGLRDDTATFLQEVPRNSRLVFLSATVPNAREFADWVAQVHQQPCHIAYTDYLPTPIHYYIFFCGGDSLYLGWIKWVSFLLIAFRKHLML